MIRILFTAGLLALPALAQVQLFQFDGSTETAVGQTYNVGTWAPGDVITTRFRVFNQGQGPVKLQTVAVSGAGFQILTLPSPMPYTIAPGQFAEFKVTFSPPAVAVGYSANMLVTTDAGAITVVLRGAAAAAATLYLNGSALSAGSAIDFGNAQTGTSVARNFTLTNASSLPVTVSAIVVSGAAFKGPVGLKTPVTLAGNQSVAFEIDFVPASAQSESGSLSIDNRAFILTGLGVNPPLPKAALQLSAAQGVSAMQDNISVQLASPSAVAGSGTLTMNFQPAVSGTPIDPAIRFMSGPAFATTVTIGVGDTVAKFGGSTSFAFQTGTTAGTITFTLKLPNDTDQTTLVIPPAMVSLDSATGTRRVSDLDVSLIGFDNTHTASQIRFTFYDLKGNVLQPGAILTDEGAVFSKYFAAGAAGGMFQLRATFPVSGDATQVAGVDVEITNSIGVTKTQRIPF